MPRPTRPTRPTRRLGARFRAFVQADAASIRQSLAALLVASLGNLAAGLTLGAITGTIEDLPGLLVLVPAAIGMRGNIFGTLGSRLGTAIHQGTFNLSRRPDTVVGQNVLASAVLTLSVSAALAVLAKTVAVGFGVSSSISVADFLVISVLGGVLSSVVVLAITLLVAASAVRFGWDMDNVSAPLVTAAGDVATLPALFLATYLVGIDLVTPMLATVMALIAVVALVVGLRSGLPLLRAIVREAFPVLLVAGLVDVVAGVTIEARLDSFLVYPALLVLIPPFLEDAGALGGILASRLATKLHLGVVEPTPLPGRVARRDFLLIGLYAVPLYVVLGLSVDLVSAVFGLESPGALQLVAVSLVGGMIATACALAIGYYGSIATFRLGFDPDNYGIPIMTSSMDLVGALAVILAIALVGVT